MRWLVRLYDRRIVNVNVNIIVAGLMAMGITVAVMHLSERWGVVHALQGWIGKFSVKLPWQGRIVGGNLVISGMTLGVDALADIIVYFGLHWFANHMPRTRIPRLKPEYQELTFLRDATLVQFERAVLSPLLYVLALGTQNTLLHRGGSVAASTAIGLTTGMTVARLLHTMWMMRQERRAGKDSAADLVGPDKAKRDRVEYAERPAAARPARRGVQSKASA